MMAYCLALHKEECNDDIKGKVVRIIEKQKYKIVHSKNDYLSLVIRSCLIRGGLLLMDNSSLCYIMDFYNRLQKKWK